MELQKLYRRRFEPDLEYRQALYQVLCQRFFQRYVPEDATVLDLAAGYCEFVNSIRAARRIAVDLNPDVATRAAHGVEVLTSASHAIPAVGSGSVDVVYTSNFLEHITKPQILATFHEVMRVLRPGGRFLVLQPNIRFCARDYWMFFDHITPLDDRSLCEALEVSGFAIRECRPRFLPYTTKSLLPKALWLVRAYLALPLLHRIFGQQAFVVAEKPTGVS